jgi:antitoxin component YwqK of YwqJK toxin-antitoxin module
MKNLSFILFISLSFAAKAQLKSFTIGVKGDTLNKIDNKNLKQGKWTNHVDEVRGEPGFEEEGEFKNGRKEGVWRIYNLNGDLTGLEFYKWGNKDGQALYYNAAGELIREEHWRALNPDKPYDTLTIEDIDHLNEYKTVIVKNEGVGIRDGQWKYFNPSTGMIYKTENYTLGKLETPKASKSDTTGSSTASNKALAKPKEVQEYEKKNSGKKKVRVRDGSTSD